jgi:hypothetical protein
MPFIRNDRLQEIVFAAALACASWFCLSGSPRLHGDGLEYILQTQAISLHGQLSIDCDALRDYWNATNPYGVTLTATRDPQAQLSESAQAGGGWGGLYPDRFGEYRYYHFWAYSLAVAPLYTVLHCLVGAPFEYQAFRLMNGLLLLVPFIAAWCRKPCWTLTVIFVLSLFSPLVPYTDWQHPEIFCFSLIFLSFWLAASPRWFWWAPFPLGIAAAQNIPISLFFPLHLAYMLYQHRQEVRSSPHLAVGAYGAALLVAAGSTLYWLYYFGCMNVIAAVGGADLRFSSLGRVSDLFLSPAVGAVWLYPTLFLFLPLMIRKRDRPIAALAAATVLAVSYLAVATGNFNAGQVGSLRYAVWILAPFWYLLTTGVTTDSGNRAAYRNVLLTGCVVLNLVMLVVFKSDRLARKDTRRFEGSHRGVPEVAALYSFLRYNDDAEILAETIQGEELSHRAQFNGIYLWTLTSRSTLCVISRQDAPGFILAEWPASAPFAYRTAPKGNAVLQFTNGVARLILPGNATYRKHPYLGENMIVWMETAVTDPRGFVKMSVRDSR